ncbi:MAG: chitobiase/beta-hexosaminidase C-terminal domain-containing protein [Spirochaetota bacterium]
MNIRSSIVVSLIVVILCADAAELRLADAAQSRQLPPGAPKASDVVMRSLAPRPASKSDPHDTLAAVAGFHVTRLEWTYTDKKEFIDKVHALGVWFGGAVSAGNYKGSVSSEQWNVVNIDGTPVYATWMRAWKKPNPWGCANNPEFRDGHVRFVIDSIRAGADGMQRDEPAQGKHALRWGGCFCDHCMKGFQRYLKDNTDAAVLSKFGITDTTGFDYRAYLKGKNYPSGDDFMKGTPDELRAEFERFQVRSTVEFNKWWRTEVNRITGRTVPITCNNGVRDWSEIELAFDSCIGELNAADAQPSYLYEAMRKAASFNRGQTVTMPLRSDPKETPDWITHIRKTIAVVYAVGGHIEAPWDTYLPTPKGDRFFGKPEQYADMFAFIRASAPYLDGYEDAYAHGADIDDARWTKQNKPFHITRGGKGIYAFARVLPGTVNAPVAIHGIDWKRTPAPFTVSLDPDAFGGVPLRVKLLTPIPYTKDMHDAAFAQKDYSRMVSVTELSSGFSTSIDMPALEYAIIIVEPLKAADGVWQPHFQHDDVFYGKTSITIASATKGADIYVTKDGSEPSLTSERYRGPILLREDMTLRARAHHRGEWSKTAEAHFVREAPLVDIIRNGGFDNGTESWETLLWQGKTSANALAAEIDSTGRISGKNSLRLTVNERVGAVYYLRIAQPFTAEPNADYALTFRAFANGPMSCRAGLQGKDAPHTVIGMRTIELTSTPSAFRIAGRSKDTASEALVQFDLGGNEPGSVLWLDDVRLTRIDR